MDVKIVFLNGVVEEEIYIEQPRGFKAHSMDMHVFRIKRDLYGIKHALQA